MLIFILIPVLFFMFGLVDAMGQSNLIFSKSSALHKHDIFKNISEDSAPVVLSLGKTEAKVLQRRRRRRQLWKKIKVNFINKSGRHVKVYQAVIYGRFAFLKHQFDLRPNEPRGLEISQASLWVVKDSETGANMFINGRDRYIGNRIPTKDFIDLKIRNPSFLRRHFRLGRHKPIAEKFLRVMLVADSSVTARHGEENVKKYILTIMNIVSRVFKEKSLGIKINIIVTRIHIMKSNPGSYKLKKNDPKSSITSACRFATSLRADIKNPHEFIIVLTRESIGPSGYAAMYTMCTKLSCTLVKESGFNTAYVIAHETGHALGIDHDGEDGECEDDKLRGSIMAPKVYSKHEQYHWSNCSKRALYENIRYFKCMNKKPTEQEAIQMQLFDELPGEMFSKPAQCKYKLGEQASACYVYYGACSFLWCRLGFWAPCRASISASPLEGTMCGTNKWCMKGKCVSNTAAPVNGRWSTWTEFGDCTGLCDAGIRRRKRKCDNPPPKNGGRKCRGDDKSLIACNLEKCTSLETKMRKRQESCKSLGDSWEYYDVDELENKLMKVNITCNFEKGPCGWRDDTTGRLDWFIHNGRTRSSRTGPKHDNTHRTPLGQYIYLEASWIKINLEPKLGDFAQLVSPSINAPSICLSFHYHMYGEHIGSLELLADSKEEPMSLIWSMEGSQGDKWVKAEVTIEHKFDYRIVFKAVRGNGYRSDIALDDIEVRAGNCKRVKDNPCKASCTSSNVHTTADVQLGDGVPCYSNSSLDTCFQGKCQVIGCDLRLGSRKQLDQCGICGGDGKSCKIVKTKRTIIAAKTLQEVYVIPEGSEDIQVIMESHPSLFTGVYIDNSNATNVFNTDGNRWPTGNYTINGDTFTYERDSLKERITIGKLVYQGCRIVVYNPLAAEFHMNIPTAKPSLSVKLPLSKDYDQFEYNVKSWTPCSKSCGGGVQRATLACIEKSTYRQLTDLYCNDIMTSNRELSRSCNIQPCTKRYIWDTEKWSNCTPACGLGIRNRTVRCLDVHHRIHVKSIACSDYRPKSSQLCYSGPCRNHNFVTEPWSTCSKSCNSGIQRRRVTCVAQDQALKNLPLSSCPGEFPITARSCNLRPCMTFEWVHYNLGTCSVSCGGGVQIRIVSCRRVYNGLAVHNGLCKQPRPPVVVFCNSFSC